MPPRFRDSAFFDKGENACIKIPFTGNPKPNITWTREGERVETGARFQVKTEERHALLTIVDCSRADSGPYTITANNELGQDFAIINVQVCDCISWVVFSTCEKEITIDLLLFFVKSQVSDRPDPPRWPTCSQIGSDSLVLEWQQPNWDGGSAITNYIVEKQELPMTGWTRAGHTRFNVFPVTGLTPGKEYKFRVFAENVHGRSDASDESTTVQTQGVVKKKEPKTKYESKLLFPCLL